MKILYVMETISSGGVEQRRLNLVKALYNKHEFAFVCSSARGYVADELKRLGIPVYEVGAMTNIFQTHIYFKALSAAKEFKPDIIHGGVFEGNLQATFISLLTNNKNLILEETSAPVKGARSNKANLLIKLISMRAKKFIGVSKASYNYLVNVAKVNTSIAVHINNATMEVPTSLPCELDKIRKNYRLEGMLVIGTVSRLFDEYKKVSDLIIAFSKCHNFNENICLLIVGDGPDKERLQSLSEKLCVSDKVIFAGYQKNTKKFYDIMDVFVLTSASEAFGLVLVEAMFSRLPIVATNTGGIPYVIRDDMDGLLVPVGQTDEISEAMNRFIDSPELRESFGSNGYKNAKKEFSFNRYVDDIESIYNKIIK